MGVSGKEEFLPRLQDRQWKEGAGSFAAHFCLSQMAARAAHLGDGQDGKHAEFLPLSFSDTLPCLRPCQAPGPVHGMQQGDGCLAPGPSLVPVLTKTWFFTLLLTHPASPAAEGLGLAACQRVKEDMRVWSRISLTGDFRQRDGSWGPVKYLDPSPLQEAGLRHL